jgi:hypothetical protein
MMAYFQLVKQEGSEMKESKSETSCQQIFRKSVYTYVQLTFTRLSGKRVKLPNESAACISD